MRTGRSSRAIRRCRRRTSRRWSRRCRRSRGPSPLSLRRRRALFPYLLLAPGLVWLVVFYLLPSLTQPYVSLQTGTLETGYTFTWAWETYTEAVSDYGAQFGRSFLYAGIATVLAFVISFPLAYYIAFKAKRKNLLLLLIVLPFFTSYLIRTVAWQTILSDDGFVVNTLQTVGLLGEDGRLLAKIG